METSLAKAQAGGIWNMAIPLPDEWQGLNHATAATLATFNTRLTVPRGIMLGFRLPFLAFDTLTRITFLNQGALDMLDIPEAPSDWTGRTAGEFFYQDPGRETNVAKVMRGAEDFLSSETVFPGRKGRKGHLRADRCKRFDQDNRLAGGFCTYADLTPIRESEGRALARTEHLDSIVVEAGAIAQGVLQGSESLSDRTTQVTNGAALVRTNASQARAIAAAAGEQSQLAQEIADSAGAVRSIAEETSSGIQFFLRVARWLGLWRGQGLWPSRKLAMASSRSSTLR